MLQEGNLYTHILHCPGVNKNLVRGVILAVYFLNAYAVLVCTELAIYQQSIPSWYKLWYGKVM